MRELLEDGEWHETEKIINVLVKLVPPGRAKRKAEWIRVGRARAAGRPAPERSKPRSDEFLIRSGARRIVRDAIARTLRVEHKMEDGVRYVRLNSEH